MSDAPHFYIGLATTGHDPALAIVNDVGEVLFAEATERPAQFKNGWGLAPDHPHLAASCLNQHCPPGARFTVATSWQPLTPERHARPPSPFLTQEQLAWLAAVNAAVRRAAGDGIAVLRGAHSIQRRLDFEHHLCHAAAACYFAPEGDALCAVIDGEGDVGAASFYSLNKGKLKRLWRSWGPASLGAAYGWLTDACGFDWTAGEQWKVMGLAAYGTPHENALTALRRLIPFEDGRPQPCTPDVLEEVAAAISPWCRRHGDPIEAGADLAAATQAIYVEWADQMLSDCQQRYPHDRLILSGGCALNSSYNGTLRGRLGFDTVYIPPAPADDGNALGAALLAWQADHPGQPLPRGSGTPFLGTQLGTLPHGIARPGNGWEVDIVKNPASAVATMLATGNIVGVMRDAAEFGPRALGHRSILADPRLPDMKDRINRTVKGREPYRPFAPVVRESDTDRLFYRAQPAPYMSFTLPWREAAAKHYPAVVHKDGTGRVQTVQPGDFLYDVLDAFAADGGDVVLNTSLNVMGRPIVHSPEDAVAVLATTGLDALLIGDFLIRKSGPQG